MNGITNIDRLGSERDLLRQGLRRVAGVDEAGRGPLAGPVVAAAVIFPAAWITGTWPAVLAGLNDSKQLSPAQRERFFAAITALEGVEFAIAQSEAATIDELNILVATHRAMAAAVAMLAPPTDHVLVDGLEVKLLGLHQTALVKGDSRSYSIAAASVLAKVTRDRQMLAYDQVYPEYGFARHKGYPTPEHLTALGEHGPCAIHRRSFAPVSALQQELF